MRWSIETGKTRNYTACSGAEGYSIKLSFYETVQQTIVLCRIGASRGRPQREANGHAFGARTPDPAPFNSCLGSTVVFPDQGT